MSDDLEYDDDDPIFREVLSHCPHCKQKVPFGKRGGDQWLQRGWCNDAQFFGRARGETGERHVTKTTGEALEQIAT